MTMSVPSHVPVHRSCVETLLDLIPRAFEPSMSPHVATGIAIRGALAALVSSMVYGCGTSALNLLCTHQGQVGGHVLLFQSSICNYGPGLSTPRNETEVLNTPQEKSLFSPQDTMWADLADECAAAGIGISAWVFPQTFMDVATIGAHDLFLVARRALTNNYL